MLLECISPTEFQVLIQDGNDSNIFKLRMILSFYFTKFVPNLQETDQLMVILYTLVIEQQLTVIVRVSFKSVQ